MLSVPELNVSSLYRNGLVPNMTSPIFTALARKFDKAMQLHGVMYLTGTGVPSALFSRLRSEASDFFASPTADKLKYSLSEGYGAEGYTGVGEENVASSHTKQNEPPDLVESLVLHSPDTDACPESIREPVALYLDHMKRLLQLLVMLMSRGLGLPSPGMMDTFANPKFSLKLAHYPIAAATQGYGAHTDFSGFTLLAQDAADAFPAQGALQVRMDDGEWVTVPPLRNALVVNAGDLIERLSNGKYKSPVHRVVLANARTTSRLSIIYFTAPADDIVIEPHQFCCSKENPARYEPVTAGDWLKRKLSLTNITSDSLNGEANYR